MADIGGEGVPVDARLTVRGVDDQFFTNPEAPDAGERDQIAAIVGFRERRDPARAAARLKRRAGLSRLDHADHPLCAERVIDHPQITRFKNIQRQLPAGQQQGAGQRKERDRLRQAAAAWSIGLISHRVIARRRDTLPVVTKKGSMKDAAGRAP